MSTSANTLSGDPASVRVCAFENASELTGRILPAALFLISGLGKIGSYAAAMQMSSPTAARAGHA